MTQLETILRKIDSKSPIVFDNNVLSENTPLGMAIPAYLYSEDYGCKINNLASLPRRAITREIEIINDILYAIQEKNPAFISEVLKESAEYIRLLEYDAIFAERVSEEEMRNKAPEKIVAVRKTGESLRELIAKREIFQREMENHDPRVCFEKEEMSVYERLFEISKRYLKAIEVPRNSQTKIKLGEELETDPKIAATALTLSLTAPTYLITKDVPMMRTVRYGLELLQNADFVETLPVKPGKKLFIINASNPLEPSELLFSIAS